MTAQTYDLTDIGTPTAAFMAVIERRKLTREQSNFIMLYVQYDMAGRSRAKRYQLVEAAGYKAKQLRRAYGQIMADPNVLEAIDELYDQRARSTTMKAAQVTKELCKVAVANITDFITVNDEGLPELDMSDVDDEQMATVKTIKTKRVSVTRGTEGNEYTTVTDTAEIVMHDKLKALTTLGRYLRLEPSLQDDVPPETIERIPPRELAMNIMTAIASMVETVKKEPIDVTPNQEVQEAEIVEASTGHDAHVQEVEEPAPRRPAAVQDMGQPDRPRRRPRPAVD